MHRIMWLCLKNIPNHFHLLPLCRMSGWTRRMSGWTGRVSGPFTSFPTRVHLRFTGLFLAVSGPTL